MRRHCRVNLFTMLAMTLVLAGCATTRSPGTIIKTLHALDDAAPFHNLLVISVAGDVPSRVRFEQDLVAALSGRDLTTSAFYTIVGRQAQLTRGVLNTVIRAREFDAVVLIRIKGQDQPNLVPNRPTGRGFELFLYEYEELNNTAAIEVGSTVSFVVEVYDAGAKKKVWAIESLLFDTESVESVISDQVAAIAAEIFRDGLVK